MTDVQEQLIASLLGETPESLATKLLPASWESIAPYWSWHELLPNSVVQVWDHLTDETKLVAYIVGENAAGLANSLQAR